MAVAATSRRCLTKPRKSTRMSAGLHPEQRVASPFHPEFGRKNATLRRESRENALFSRMTLDFRIAFGIIHIVTTNF
ncbi:MAG: hypothetical protein ACOH2H_01940 [Cypionkella sp.]